jgi:Tfp pilus assembly protein PilV
MCTFPEKMSAGHGRLCGLRSTLRERLNGDRGEDGFLLVEVLISAMLVALIVVATFNGLDVATRLSADQRRHDEAAILVAQSQEQLRSEPASALDGLVGSPHTYTKTVGGTTFKITQEAKTVASGGKTTGCNVTETSAQTGSNFQITSSATWRQQEAAKRNPVKASDIVTPPTGSAIEVDVTNGLSQGVAGVTAKATFIPVESGSYNTVEGTTGSAGCVVLTGIQATKATIEIVEKTGYVTPTGALKVPPKELTIAPNITTHYQVQYAEAGRIEAHFTYKGETTFEGKEVVSDTFVAANNGGFGIKPEYEPGSTAFKYEATGEEQFLPLTAKALASALPSQKPYLYGPASWTAAGSKYPVGDLFPFKSKWLTYAGDCLANDTGSEAEAEAGPVKSGETATVNVPVSYTKLSIWKGSQAKHEEPTSKSYGPVKITNTECESAPNALTPPNATGIAFTHEQKETLPEGRLEVPFQPFGNNFKLCVVDSENGQTYTVPFSNTTAAGSTPNIYLNQRPNATINSEHSSAEATMKAKEAFKEKGGYSNKANEAKTEKAKYEEWLNAYNVAHGKYETEKTAYTNAFNKYTAEKTAYTNDKSKYETELGLYNTDKSKYETELGNYNTYKTKYESKKKEYEKKKEEYEKAKTFAEKTKFKEEYEKLQTEYKEYETKYKAAETAYKKYEGEYKAAETAYKKYKAEYEAAETAYLKYKGEYEAAETAYKKYEGEYKTAETEYKKYETAYKTDETQAAEYQGYLEYNAAKVIYEKTKTEQEEASASGVTVQAGNKC